MEMDTEPEMEPELNSEPELDSEPEPVCPYTDEQLNVLIREINVDWVSSFLYTIFNKNTVFGSVDHWSVPWNWDQLCILVVNRLRDIDYVRSLSFVLSRTCQHPFSGGVYLQQAVALLSLCALLDILKAPFLETKEI